MYGNLLNGSNTTSKFVVVDTVLRRNFAIVIYEMLIFLNEYHVLHLNRNVQRIAVPHLVVAMATDRVLQRASVAGACSGVTGRVEAVTVTA